MGREKASECCMKLSSSLRLVVLSVTKRRRTWSEERCGECCTMRRVHIWTPGSSCAQFFEKGDCYEARKCMLL